MNFSEYFNLVRRYLKKKISKDELCMLLFDSVIEPLDLTNANADVVSYNAARLNEIANGKRPVPVQIKENIFEDEVAATIVDYFSRNVVPLLTPNHEDICYQMLQLINADNSISPASKMQLRMLAKSETIAAFLASAFTYAVRYDPDLDKVIEDTQGQTIEKPCLHLVGIHDSTVFDDLFFVEKYVPSFQTTIEEMISTLLEQYKEISCIHLGSKPVFNIFSSSQRFQALSGLEKKPIEIKEGTKHIIKQVGEYLDTEISDDFFELGDLCRNPLKTTYAVLDRGSDIEGSDEAYRKYKLILSLEERINETTICMGIEKALENLQCVKLGIKNSGTTPDMPVIFASRLKCHIKYRDLIL